MIVGSAHSRAVFARERTEAVIMWSDRPSVAPRARKAGLGLPAKRAFQGPQRLTGQGPRSVREATPKAPLRREERSRTLRGATEGLVEAEPGRGVEPLKAWWE
jgi:hypothetical protein